LKRLISTKRLHRVSSETSVSLFDTTNGIRFLVIVVNETLIVEVWQW